MYLIDTHTHLFLKEFEKDIEKVISRSIENKVKKLILPNIDSTSIIPLLNLCKKHKNICFPSIGLHPSSVKENFKEELKIVENYLKKEKFYFIGEIGIDLYWDKSFKKEQIFSFEKQIEFAEIYNLPIIIHMRNSYEEILKILCKNSKKNLKGIFHCFSGNLKQAENIINLGFKLGIGGVLTFKNSGLDKVVKNISLENIVLETDSPYLAPHPKRGKRNESSFLIYIAEKIAEIKNINIKEVAEITSENAMKFLR